MRTKLVVAGNWHQFSNWLRENKVEDDERVVFVRDFWDLAGRLRTGTELIAYGTWYENTKAIEAIAKWLLVPEMEIVSRLRESYSVKKTKKIA